VHVQQSTMQLAGMQLSRRRCPEQSLPPTASSTCPATPERTLFPAADILQLVGLKSFRVAAVLLGGLLAYGAWPAKNAASNMCGLLYEAMPPAATKPPPAALIVHPSHPSTLVSLPCRRVLGVWLAGGCGRKCDAAGGWQESNSLWEPLAGSASEAQGQLGVSSEGPWVHWPCFFLGGGGKSRTLPFHAHTLLKEDRSCPPQQRPAARCRWRHPTSSRGPSACSSRACLAPWGRPLISLSACWVRCGCRAVL
jgi:hypothetical protein